jgi:hypothetical protein
MGGGRTAGSKGNGGTVCRSEWEGVCLGLYNSKVAALMCCMLLFALIYWSRENTFFVLQAINFQFFGLGNVISGS